MTVVDQIRTILSRASWLSVDAWTLDEQADLFQAGLNSHAGVALMLAVEDQFEIEFPEAMIQRDLVRSIAAIDAAVHTMLGDRPPPPQS